MNSIDPGQGSKAELGILVQNTAKRWSGTVHSKSSPHISAFHISFLCQSQMDSQSNSESSPNLQRSLPRITKLCLGWKISSSLGRPQTHQLLLLTLESAASPTGSPHITLTYDFMTGKTLLLACLCPPLAGLSQDLSSFPLPVHFCSI